MTTFYWGLQRYGTLILQVPQEGLQQKTAQPDAQDGIKHLVLL